MRARAANRWRRREASGSGSRSRAMRRWRRLARGAALRFGAAFFADAFLVTFFALVLASFSSLARSSLLRVIPRDFFFAFDFFAMIDLPISLRIASRMSPPHLETDTVDPARPAARSARATAGECIATCGRCSCKLAGQAPPVAQSINSTVWTAGRSVPAAICVMQPILPAAITSGRNLSIVPTLRSRNRLAMSGCRML